jgi:hypothetical protein
LRRGKRRELRRHGRKKRGSQSHGAPVGEVAGGLLETEMSQIQLLVISVTAA